MRGSDAVRRGATLLEVIVALAILGAIAGSAMALAADASRVLHSVRTRDADIRAASAFLEKVALWPRDDLDRRLGERQQGRWRLELRRDSPTLYSVELRDSGGGSLLQTVLFRPATDVRVGIHAP